MAELLGKTFQLSLDRIYLQSLQKESLCRIASPHISTELIRVFCNLALGQAVVGRIDLS
jgi:hypothetical protein